MRRQPEFLIPLFFLCFAALVPGVASAAYDHHWCFKFGTTPQDAGIGEDYGVNVPGEWIARGVKVNIKKGLTTVFDGFTDTGDGCIDFTHTAGADIYAVRVYAYTKLSFTEEFRIRAWDSEAHFDDWNANQTSANLEQWYYNGVPIACVGTNCLANVTTPNSDAVGNMLAYATFQVHRTEAQSDPHLNLLNFDNLELHLINDACSGGGSCQSGTRLFIDENADRRKFLVGHEVGHWLQFQWQGQELIQAVHNGQVTATQYLPTGIADGMHPYCVSDDIDDSYLHFMNSVEYQAGGFTEGFAHFLATFAYNNHTQDDAYFKYYKSWGFLYNYNLINVETGGESNGGVTDFLHDGCGCPTSDANCDYYGVEIDWLRHYWDYLTNGIFLDPEPNIATLFAHIDDAYDNNTPDGFDRNDAHDQLEAELNGDALQEWDYAADFNGADSVPE